MTRDLAVALTLCAIGFMVYVMQGTNYERQPTYRENSNALLWPARRTGP